MTDIRTSVDGAPDDRVAHELVNAEHMAQLKKASDQLRAFRAPVLVHAGNPHEKLFIAAFDGTGNNKYRDPLHATNVAKIDDELWARDPSGIGQIYSHYVVGPGTQVNPLTSLKDAMRGSSYGDNIVKAYDELVRQANSWKQNDPDALIRVHSIGFSRGASQVPGFARLLHERGIPDLLSEVIGPDGVPTYSQYIARPGETAQAVGLFDPVATGAPMKFDRRLPPSVISGFQITAADERRATFPSDRIIPLGFSDDGRFLNVTVPGAHSDVGGGYLRDGLSSRCGNLMRDYCNALRDEPYLQKAYEPTDPRLMVIHHSHKGVDLFRMDPRRFMRSEPSGINERLAPRDLEHAGPTPHKPEPRGYFVSDTPVREGIADGPANTIPDRDALFSARPGSVELAGDRIPVAHFATRMATVAGVVADTVDTYQKISASDAAGNATAATSYIVHQGSHTAAGWAGAKSFMAAGAALGVESGPGIFLTGAIGGVVGFVAGDKIADAYDQYRIRNQKDPQGRAWQLDDQHGWVRDLQSSQEHPQGKRLTADPILSSLLSYQASSTAAELALATDYRARDPFTQPAARGDTPSLREAPWIHQAKTHQWTRDITDGHLEHGLVRSHRETASPQRAAELDRAAEQIIRQNVAESPLGVAQRYHQTYEQQGWYHHGPLPEAVGHALHAPTDKVLASDGHTYTHSHDGEWSRPGIFATHPATDRMQEELAASERVAEGLKFGTEVAGLNHPAAPPTVPSRLDDPGHPDHAFFKQVREHVVALDKSMGRSPDQYTDNIASALTVQARADGLSSINEIALSANGNALWAIQTPPGRKDHLFDLSTKVPTAEATTPLEQSGAKWEEAMQQFQSHEQARAQSQQLSMERSQAARQAQEGPSMAL